MRHHDATGRPAVAGLGMGRRGRVGPGVGGRLSRTVSEFSEPGGGGAALFRSFRSTIKLCCDGRERERASERERTIERERVRGREENEGPVA